MGADVDISKFLHPIDLVSPVEAALHLRNARQNEETQRMFAQNTIARQSAEDKRRELEDKEKHDEKERQRRIDQATALGAIQQMMRQPGGAGPAQALGAAYDININPLTATTQAAHAAPEGDAVDQFLARNAAEPGSGGSPGPEALMGPGDADAMAIRQAPTSVTSGGMAPVVAASREGAPGETLEGPQQMQDTGPGGRFLLPTAFHVSPGMQAAMDHKGYVPPGSAELPSGPSSAAPAPGELEALMSRAAPAPAPQAQPAAPPMPLLYEAVMGGKHYPISAEQPKINLGPKYDQLFQQYMSMPGAHPDAAFKAVMADKEKDDAQAATEHRMLAVMGGRNDHQDTRDATYRMTVEDQKAKDTAHLANARAVARIKAASASPGMDPKAQAFLAHALDMAEKGATDAEIAAAGRDAHVDPKVWTGQVNAEDRKANADTRTNERRAGMEVQLTDGSVRLAASPQEATKMRDQESKFQVVKQRVQDLISDVEKNGTRVDLLSPDQIQNRLSKGAAANAALRPYNGLGGTDASQKLEADITGALGAPGHGWLFGANPTVLHRILSEAEDKHARDIAIRTRPGGGAPLPAAITHDKPKGNPQLNDLDSWLKSKGY